jgi:hypothetical protein
MIIEKEGKDLEKERGLGIEKEIAPIVIGELSEVKERNENAVVLRKKGLTVRKEGAIVDRIRIPILRQFRKLNEERRLGGML